MVPAGGTKTTLNAVLFPRIKPSATPTSPSSKSRAGAGASPTPPNTARSRTSLQRIPNSTALSNFTVEPEFEDRIVDDDEARALIVSANLQRRNLTKGQQAMALAVIYPEPPRGRGKVDQARKEAETASFSYRRYKEARQILRHSEKMAHALLHPEPKQGQRTDLLRHATSDGH